MPHAFLSCLPALAWLKYYDPRAITRDYGRITKYEAPKEKHPGEGAWCLTGALPGAHQALVSTGLPSAEWGQHPARHGLLGHFATVALSTLSYKVYPSLLLPLQAASCLCPTRAGTAVAGRRGALLET